ncbi:Protein kinase-like (PK-like), partial [Erysiphe pulchra]
MNSHGLELVVQRLSSPDFGHVTDIKVKYEAAVQLRDNLENYVALNVYPAFLKKIVPIFINLLSGPPVFISTSMEQKLRNCVLEIIHHLPTTPPEHFEPYAVEIVNLLIGLVRVDNEENALTCVKSIMDMMRNQTKILQDEVQPFLTLIQELFGQMEAVVQEQLDCIPNVASQISGISISHQKSQRPGSPVTTSVTDLGTDFQQQNRPLIKGMQSFRVLAECPIIVVSIFQLYRTAAPSNVKTFIPLIKRVLLLQAKPQEQAHLDAAAKGTIFIGVSPEIRNRVAFAEFINAQVKTMSFLAYLLRIYSQQLTDFLPNLPIIIVRLLQDCPREKSAARKELLVAIRHLINFNFRKIFISKIDELLDERTLIGDGLTVYETIRPLAYTMLADLIHHVRDSLEPQQIRRTVEVYTKNLQDSFPGTSFQTMSAKLLLNMAECISKMKNKADARHYLIMILNAIGDKFAAMNRQYPNAVKLSSVQSDQTTDPLPENYLANKSHPPQWDEIDIFTSMPIKTSISRDRGSDSISDNKFLFRILVNGLKNTFYQLKACNIGTPIDVANAPAVWQEVSYGFSAEEVQVIIKLFREGSHVFRYYDVEMPASESQHSTPVEFMANHYMISSSKEEKDLLETFATVFHCIDPATFHEVFHEEIPRLYDTIFEHTALLHIPQFFLASEATSPSFAGMLLKFLMSRIHEVGNADVKKSSILLRLFKLAFMAVTLFSNQNEQVLIPHVVDIVTKSIELSTTAEEPMNYFILLRSLFRSIGGGKFEHLYKKILPLIEMLLEVLNSLLHAARKPSDRDLYVELCLTVPARLSNLLPHLSYLMRPLVVALGAGSDIVGQGLRTLELCVDNLTSDYLDPIMAPVIDELMTALFDHLRPTPYSHFHAHTTLRILGKLGGRNRKFMTGAVDLHFQKYSDDVTSFDLRLIGSKKDRAFPAEIGIDLAIRKLMEIPRTTASKKSDTWYKKHALHLIKTHLKLRLGVDGYPDDFGRLVRLQAQDLLSRECNVDLSSLEASDKERSIAKKYDQDKILKKLIKACLFAVSLPEFALEATTITTNICKHFTLLQLGRGLAEMRQQSLPFDVNVKSGEGPLYIDDRVLGNAIIESLSSDLLAVREAAQNAIQEIYNSAATILGSETRVCRLPFFAYLSNLFCHNCYKEEWFSKTGGCLGINLIITKVNLGDAWIYERQIDYLRALMYVIKDMPLDLPAKIRNAAQLTLDILLNKCAKVMSKADLQPPPPTQAGQRPSQPTKLYQLCTILNTELSHMNPHVRDTAKRALKIIAREVGLEVYELLEPSKERCLIPIYSKPLRALPFGVQIGFIDAITFYMSLKSDFVRFDDHLNRLLMESLALADAPDESLAGKPAEFRTHESIIRLRVACIKILSTAMGFEEFQKGQANPTRTKILSVFFKCLYAESKETIEAANDALKVFLLQTSKLPKDLLQNSLRPVLAKLQDPRRLSTHGLDALARLLQLLTTYFKVEIGSRLLDHIKVLAEVGMLQRTSFSLIEQNEQMKIIAAVINIFHLLPPAAEGFKERLIETTLDLEEGLRRTRHSPFRLRLNKYLNKYPREIFSMFLKKIGELKYGRFLAQVLEYPDSGPLRDVVQSGVESLFQSCGDISKEYKDTHLSSVINLINIIHSLLKASDEMAKQWINTDHIVWLRMAGKNLENGLQKNTLPSDLRLAAEQAGDQLMIIYTKYLDYHPKDFDSLFNLIDAVTASEMKSSQTLYAFLYRTINSNSIDHWRLLILRGLEVYASKTVSQKTKAFVLHNLVNPIIAMDVMRYYNVTSPIKSPRLLDKTVIESIHAKIWKVGLGDPNDDLTQPGIDHTRLEVLQLTAMLVKYYHAILHDARKDIIRFAYTYIRLEDIINKHAAYVVIGYFIAHYDTPAKIVQQVYFSLLKTNQNEGRTLVAQALELIAPVLPKRCSSAPGDRNPIWAAAPRRILSEESQNIQQMTCIFNFLVKHADLFYDSRDRFVNLIIGSLRKIVQPPNASNDSKKLALNLMTLIWHWEQRRVEGKLSTGRNSSESPKAKRRKLDVPNESPASSITNPLPSDLTDRTEYKIPTILQTKMIKYLVEFIASLNDPFPLPSAKSRDPITHQNQLQAQPLIHMCKRAISLLFNLLQPQYWGESFVEPLPNVAEQILASERIAAVLSCEHPEKDKPDEKLLTNIINTLQIVRIILNSKPDSWVIQNMSKLQLILEKPLKSDNPEIQDCLHADNLETDHGQKLRPLLRRILDAVPEDVPMEDADADADADDETEGSKSEFISFLSSISTEALSATSGNYVSGINILWTLAHWKSSEIDLHINQVIKALQAIAREHVAHWQAITGPSGMITSTRPGESEVAGVMTQYDLEIQTGLILKAIEILSLRMDVLGDNRRPFLSVLATLVEKSHSNTLCLKILEMVEGWVFRSDGSSWPTLKEKTAVLHKMLTFENRSDDTLLTKFLELVIRIYEEPKITRTELTVRMEHAFLIGTRAIDVDMRNRFMALFDRSQSKTASVRLAYVIIAQNWDTLADSYWLAQANQLLMGSIDLNTSVTFHSEDFRTMPLSTLFGTYNDDQRVPELESNTKFDSLINSHERFLLEIEDIRARDIIDPLTQLQHLDSDVAHEIWVALFPIFWSATSKDERGELERGMVTLLTKDYHSRQIDRRYNVIQTLLEGATRAWPECKIPPHVLKFEAKTYDAWYTALVHIENAAIKPEIDSKLVRESNLDALVELYAALNEDDLFHGTWRRRCQYVETNAALSYEQNGMWDKAQQMYEQAQIKARTGALPFSQDEYMLWEDHWVLCATKLQQWDILADFAKHENFQDLLLECAWRQIETWASAENREMLDNIIKGLMDAPTPRRAFFQAFMSLIKLHNKIEPPSEFTKVCDEAIQLAIRKWHQLPKRTTSAHIPLLQYFQQLVELHDASAICQSLAQTNQANLDAKSTELKLLLGTWRDRLPNVWDDINAWQDLVTWRQHIFSLINTTYINLLPAQGSQTTNGASFAYRGYHETAGSSIDSLTIYTLPNIEIQEAFLKLREQAKCHYQNPNELSSGLDVINNTNLNYFGPNQKAEFHTLRGMFLEKLGQRDEASEAFKTSLCIDVTLAKSWAEWGHYSDRLFKENPSDMNIAKDALNCYLEAAGYYKNAKCRKLLTRILWLLSLDDKEGTLTTHFIQFQGDSPVWYWITFIPQLLTGLAHKEASVTHIILCKIAKSYPQALFFQLRTNREETHTLKRIQEAKEERERKFKSLSQGKNHISPNALPSKPSGSPKVKNLENAAGSPISQKIDNSTNRTELTAKNGNSNENINEIQPDPSSLIPPCKRPWEHAEEILAVLKTAFPLLALSMETMVDQIQKHFKCTPDEDAYRLIGALLQDALSYVSRAPSSFAQDVKLPSATETNVARFAESILPVHIRASFEADFVQKKLTMFEYIHKLRKWREKCEIKLDRRRPFAYLENYSQHLSEFKYQKFDEVEVPGQYLQHRDKNQEFVRIDRFLPTVDLVRNVGVCHRRLKIRGHDGSIHPFAIQHPAARHCRREERIVQLFRYFNGILSKRKESRRRNLNFHLPLMIPLTPFSRMIQDDSTFISLQGIFDDHCRKSGMSKDDPALFTMDKMRSLIETRKSHEQIAAARLEIFIAVQEKWVSHTIALNYFTKVYPQFSDFWLFRKQFSYQFASLTFMTYILHMNNRYPHKLNIARATGNVWGSELMSSLAMGKAYFHNPEPVPFRLTPNLQTLMGPLATEGIYGCAIMAIARCLSEPEYELEQQLCLFVRDEMIHWFQTSHCSQPVVDNQLKESVQLNSNMIVKRTLSLAQSPAGTLPANQTVIDLIARA